MSSSTSLRAQLSSEIENILAQTSELRPFISAWSVIEHRFRGIADVDGALDPAMQVHCLLMQELGRTALITEELFFSWLCNLSVLSKNVVCKSTGKVWEPRMQSFSDFKNCTEHIVVSDCINNSEKVYEFQLWVVELCNWDGLGSKSSVVLH